jgi:hypothetical protein
MTRRSFLGADVDWEWLDAFEWTPALLVDYTARAGELAGHFNGGDRPGPEDEKAEGGACADCGKERRRWRLAGLELCELCFAARRRVGRSLTEPLDPAPDRSLGHGREAYLDLWRVPWSAEALDRRREKAAAKATNDDPKEDT